MMIVGGFIYRDPINGMLQKISFLWENEWNTYLNMKGSQGNTKIHESRAKWPKICTVQPDSEATSGDLMIDDMTAEEIKSKFKEKGITTRARSLKKLQELLLNTLREE